MSALAVFVVALFNAGVVVSGVHYYWVSSACHNAGLAAIISGRLPGGIICKSCEASNEDIFQIHQPEEYLHALGTARAKP